MIELTTALREVGQRAHPLEIESVAVAGALTRVLAEQIETDVDSPPWDKAMVDGYAVRAADLATGSARLTILEEVLAGAVPTRQVDPGTAIRIMTGAPIPAGCNAVVMVEQTKTITESDTSLGQVQIDGATPAPGANILRQGTAMRRGDTVLSPGAVIGPAEVGLLCELGCAQVQVQRCPRVAILPTGDEIVDVGQVPRAGQIRNSNGPMLISATHRAGAVPVDLGIGRDRRDDLAQRIARGLECDILVLSGGVSAGVADLVPEVLTELGVEQVFHKVRLKPGKPLWFGIQSAAPGRLVFGLPGNPVSSLVCFEIFVREAIDRMAGRGDGPSRRGSGTLVREHQQRGDRWTYYPAVVSEADHRFQIDPVGWQGSADLRGLARANALACFPPGDRMHEAGESVEFLRI